MMGFLVGCLKQRAVRCYCEGSRVFPVCLVRGTEAKRANWKRKQDESFHSVLFKDKFVIKGKIVEFSNLMLLNKRQEPEGSE